MFVEIYLKYFVTNLFDPIIVQKMDANAYVSPQFFLQN